MGTILPHLRDPMSPWTTDRVPQVFITSFPAGPWQANCYVVAAPGERTCVVVDPGVQAAAAVRRITAEADLSVAGVLLTHGHLDHVANAAEVADAAGAPVWIHAADRELLTDAGPVLRQALELVRSLGGELREPADLRLLAGGETIEVAGLSFGVVHAPGHRPGCVLYRLAVPPDPASPGLPAEVVFTGDVLFAGTIGRTDLPGGDPDAMVETLRDVVLALPDAATILPGHGEATTMSAERAGNPYLQARFLSQP